MLAFFRRGSGIAGTPSAALAILGMAALILAQDLSADRTRGIPDPDNGRQRGRGRSVPNGRHPPSASGWKNVLNPFGIPCWKPPYGLMTAIDLKTGEALWEVPSGKVQKWGFHMPESWSSPTIGGSVVTASGLVFIGASMNARVRALDATSGEVLWKAQVDGPAVSNPAVYDYKGRQYVVFGAGVNPIIKPQVADQLVAFALPE